MNPFVGTEVPHRTAVAFASLAVVCAIAGCKERATETALAENAECSVIASFAAEPDRAFLADLERTNAVELEPLGAITDDLRVYRLRGVGEDEDCVAAIERLRRDDRVRSIELDARRELHNDESNAQGQR